MPVPAKASVAESPRTAAAVIHLLVFFTMVLLGWRLGLIDRWLLIASRAERQFARALPFLFFAFGTGASRTARR
jgi:hypothetical protein